MGKWREVFGAKLEVVACESHSVDKIGNLGRWRNDIGDNIQLASKDGGLHSIPVQITHKVIVEEHGKPTGPIEADGFQR